MEFIDRVLRCVDCREEFVFSAGEQTFYREKQFQNEPKHCKRCKAKRAHVRWRAEARVVCADCGTSTTVPFLPRLGKPVLCRSCFQRRQPDTSLHRGAA